MKQELCHTKLSEYVRKVRSGLRLFCPAPASEMYHFATLLVAPEGDLGGDDVQFKRREWRRPARL